MSTIPEVTTNVITIVEGDTIPITATVLNLDKTAADLTGFTATLYIMETKGSDTNLITSTGSITDNVITFNIAYGDNTLDYGKYFFKLVITSSTERFTIAQDDFIIDE